MKHLLVTLISISMLYSTSALSKQLIQTVKTQHVLQHEVPMVPVFIQRYNASSRKKGILLDILKKAFPSTTDHQKIDQLFLKVPSAGLPQFQVLNYNYFRFGPHQIRIFYNKKAIAINGKTIPLEKNKTFGAYYQSILKIAPSKKASFHPANLFVDEAHALIGWLIAGAVILAGAGIAAWHSSIAGSKTECRSKRNGEFARLSSALNNCKADLLEIQYDANYWKRSPTKKYLDGLNRSRRLEAKLIKLNEGSCVKVHEADSKYDGIFWSEPQCVEKGFLQDICDKINDVRICINSAKEVAEKKRLQEEEKRKAKEQVKDDTNSKPKSGEHSFKIE
ncbi:MAG: hypothetical protein HN509_16095 [Halobacteriovoraceae bacterium]|jgi:hypothetical protein|nr:hypothetical protein [Halobacteriovoraceae bacterium]MBT5094265.1 hypothetical protein [Halobacteriovoraceae bacterium]